MKTYLRLCLPLLVTTMACAFVQKMIFPPALTPDIPAPSQTPGPAATAAHPTEVYTPTPEIIHTPEPTACSDDDCLSACLDRLATVLEKNPLEPIGNAGEGRVANRNLVIYKVNGDEITDPRVLSVPPEYRKYQEDTEAHLRIWNFYVAIIPPDLRTLVREFVIFTDGSEGDVTAWVRPALFDKGYWQAGFDLLDADYLPYLADTLVHETAHLLTLNASQMLPDDDHFHDYDEKKQEFSDCEQFAVSGSCSLPNSYINLFYQRFWKDSYAEWWELDQEARDADTADEYFEIMEPFYDKYVQSFLNPYAATNVEEDMAESFAFFGLHPKPSGTWIYEQKIAFYYEFPELVQYRRQIIAGLCSYIGP
ncbi:MAG: hypothetical protein JW730_05325 [Anaerolineales bacterium]|nr:hypothetical protein [Anaerolineales bacterium]